MMKFFVMLFTLVVFSIYAKAETTWVNITETNTIRADYMIGSFLTIPTKSGKRSSAIIRLMGDDDVKLYTYLIKEKDCQAEMGQVLLLNVNGTKVINEIDFAFNSGNLVGAVAEFVCKLAKSKK